MNNIYVFSKKIIGKDILKIKVCSEPISLLGKLRSFLLFGNDVDCVDTNGVVNFKKNKAKDEFVIFGKEKKNFFEQIVYFCNKENIFLFNTVDTSDLTLKERIFFQKNKRIKAHIDSLKDEYEIHKANRDFIQMASCIKQAEQIVSGQIKVH